jgi:cobalt-zinc-cadmium efflux system membrane fusion protein
VLTGISEHRFSGTVDNISTLVDPNTRSVVARVVVTNPGDFLKKQMYVHVLLQARQESTGLLVPVAAVLRDDENLPYVYVTQPDGSFARQHVTLGSPARYPRVTCCRAGDRYDITVGVKAGDQIVVDGGLFVQFMQIQ